MLLFIVGSGTTISAQTISNGVYINENRNEFVVVKNDSVQFRYFNDDGFASFSIGEGTLENAAAGKYAIRSSPSFTEETSVLYSYPRNDGEVSIQFLSADSLPVIGASIQISRLQDKKPYVISTTDSSGQMMLSEEQIDYLDSKHSIIEVGCLGYTCTQKIILLERGYDYVIKSRIPAKLSGGIGGNGWVIEVLGEDEISITFEYSGRKMKKLYRRGYFKDPATILKKVSDDSSLSGFPFDKDVDAIILERL